MDRLTYEDSSFYSTCTSIKGVLKPMKVNSTANAPKKNKTIHNRVFCPANGHRLVNNPKLNYVFHAKKAQAEAHRLYLCCGEVVLLESSEYYVAFTWWKKIFAFILNAKSCLLSSSMLAC